MHFLEAMLKHRPVHLIHQSLIDPDDQVRSDAQETPVKSGVMDLAEGHPVGHYGMSVIRCIPDDVRSIEELDVFESTNRAASSVSVEHTLPKKRLMESLPRDSSGVHLLGRTERR